MNVSQMWLFHPRWGLHWNIMCWWKSHIICDVNTVFPVVPTRKRRVHNVAIGFSITRRAEVQLKHPWARTELELRRWTIPLLFTITLSDFVIFIIIISKIRWHHAALFLLFYKDIKTLNGKLCLKNRLKKKKRKKASKQATKKT